MHARTGKVRPKIGFHGPVTMQSIRRRVRIAVAGRKRLLDRMKAHAAAVERVVSMGMEPDLPDPRAGPPRVH